MRERRSVITNNPRVATRRLPGNIIQTSEAGVYAHKRIVDVSTPNFKQLQKCGEFLPLNPVVIETITHTRDTSSHHDLRIGWNPGDLSYAFQGEQGVAYWQTIPLATSASIPAAFWNHIPSSFKDNYVDLVVATSRGNAVSDKWDLLTFLAEARKTADMLRDLSGAFWRRSLYHAELAAMRFKSRKDRRYAVRDAIDWFFDTWMLARYGIRPLVYDMQDAVSYISKLRGEQSPFVKGKGKQRDADDHFETVHVGSNDPRETFARGWSYDDTYRSSAFLGLNDEWSDGLLFDPLVTGWELIPGSFVMDWVVDMSAWLSQLSPLLRGEFLGTSYSIRRTAIYREYYDVDGIMSTPSYGYYGTNGSSFSEWKLEQYTRALYDGVPLPRIDLRFDWKKAIDLLAMAKRSRSRVFQTLNRR